MDKNSRIFVAGHQGLVGSAIRRRLERLGYTQLLLRNRQELDLADPLAVRRFFEEQRPEYVFLAAAKVGGILANNIYPATFIHENLAIQTAVIHECWRARVTRLLFMGSSCIYPRDCSQPMKEAYLLTGPLEATNRPYALAKIAGVEMCWAYNRQFSTQYLATMPTNLYGPGDKYDLQNSHVLPALILKMDNAVRNRADQVTVWGTGNVRREFLYSDDLAEACVMLMNLPDMAFAALTSSSQEPPMINIGCGEDLTVRDLAEAAARVVGFRGRLVFDASKPDGVVRKLLDTTRINKLGWRPTMSLEEGMAHAYRDYLERHQSASRQAAGA